MTLVPVTAVVGGVHGARAAGGVQIQVPDGRCVSSGCEPPCPPLKLVRCDLQTPDLVFTYTANQELVSNQTGECLSLWGPTGPGVGMYVRCKCVCECRARGMGRGRGLAGGCARRHACLCTSATECVTGAVSVRMSLRADVRPAAMRWLALCCLCSCLGFRDLWVSMNMRRACGAQVQVREPNQPAVDRGCDHGHIAQRGTHGFGGAAVFGFDVCSGWHQVHAL